MKGKSYLVLSHRLLAFPHLPEPVFPLLVQVGILFNLRLVQPVDDGVLPLFDQDLLDLDHHESSNSGLDGAAIGCLEGHLFGVCEADLADSHAAIFV